MSRLPVRRASKGYAGCVCRCRMVPSAMTSPSGHRHWILPPSNCCWYGDAYTPPWRSRERWVPDSATRPASMTLMTLALTMVDRRWAMAMVVRDP